MGLASLGSVLVAVLLAGPLLAAEELLDGNVYHLDFSDTHSSVVFQFTVTDAKATTTVQLSPEVADNEAVSSEVCYDEACQRPIVSVMGFKTYDIPVDGSLLVGQTLYVKVWSTSKMSVQFTLMSSYVLTNSKTVTINVNDGYDYESNGNFRYFRAFLCNSDTSRLRISPPRNYKVEVYATSWDNSAITAAGKAVGRPTDESYEGDMDNSLIPNTMVLTHYAQNTAPSWIFFGIYMPSCSESNCDVSIITELSIPVDFGESDPIEDNVCIYEDCISSVFFNLSNSDSIKAKKTLYILLMPMENIEHTTSSPYEIIASSKNPPSMSGTNFHKEGYGNVVTIESTEYDTLLDGDNNFIYVGANTMQSYRFPQYADHDTEGAVMFTYLFDTTVLSLNGGSKRVSLQPITDTEGNAMYSGLRAILDTSEIAIPSIAANDEGDSTTDSTSVEGDYYVKVSPTSSSSTISYKLKAGLYIGKGTTDFPNTEEFLLEAENITVTDGTSIPSGSIQIALPHRSTNYFLHGAYIMDIYNDVTTEEGATPATVSVDITPMISWNLKSSIQYESSFSSYSSPQYFTLNSCNIENGVSIYAESNFTQTGNATINLFASLQSPFPDSSSPHNKSSNARASLHIQASEFENAVPVGGCYNIYLGITTSYKGIINIMYSEGADIKYTIGECQEVLPTVSSTTPSAYVEFHSDELDGANKILFRITSQNDTWPENTQVRGCISHMLITNYSSCDSKTSYRFTIYEHNSIYTKGIDVDSSDESQDYFISLFYYTSNKSAMELSDGNVNNIKDEDNQSSITLSVFAQHYKEVPENYYVDNIVSYNTEPFLLYFETTQGYDYSVVSSITNYHSGTFSYDVRICHDRPSYSATNPDQIDAASNKRNCSDYILTDEVSVIHDVSGDIDDNEKTDTDDSDFILSSDKYISYYPKNDSIIGLQIKTEIYKDVHVPVNRFNKELYGKAYEYGFFRLKIPGKVSANAKDTLVYQFTTDYPLSYCLSKKLHTKPGDTDATCEKSVVNFVPTKDNNIISDFIVLNEYDITYTADEDLYVYFSYYFPDEPSDGTTNMMIYFSNSVSHYLEILDSDSETVKSQSHVIDMSYLEVRSFTTRGFDPNKNIRFLMTPYITDMEEDLGSSVYYNNQISVNVYEHDSTINIRPTPILSNFSSAGIVLFEYEFKDKNIDDWSNAAIRFVTAMSRISKSAQYKTLFVGPQSETFTNGYSNIQIMDENKYYRYKYDPTSTNKEDNAHWSGLYYFPSASKDNMLRVFPCAGAPGMYASYITENPHWDDGMSLYRPTGMRGYKYGTSFYQTFYAYTDTENYTELTVPTGMMFNFTVDYAAFTTDPDPYHNVRWDAEAWIIPSENRSATGGPSITNSTITIKGTYGLQINVEFSEALSGVASNPNITRTHIEYAVFAIPAVPDNDIAQYFDASPYTHCGMMYYGFAITADRKTGTPIWKKGNSDSGADGNGPNAEKFTSKMVLKTSYDPNKHEYKDSNIRPNLKKEEPHMFNINVVAREINDETGTVIGYSVYSPIKIKISGSFPVVEDGLFAWEVVLIVLGIVAAIVIVVLLVVVWQRKKKLAQGYGNLDGEGNGKGQVLNVEVPDDDLSTSAFDRESSV